MKYMVDLEATALVAYTVYVEAEDEQAAKQYAVERAPRRSSMWVSLDGEVTKVDAVFVQPEPEEV